MRFILALALCAFLAAPAYAAYEGPGAGKGAAAGGYYGPMAGAEADTVTQAMTLHDDARVSLTGHIINKIVGSDDKYTFKDNTGEIIVDIDRKKFRGQKVTPETTVRIYGKVDKDFGEAVKIDVKQLEVVN